MCAPAWPPGKSRVAAALLVGAVIAGCASLPPGSDYPRTASTALAHPEATPLGRQFDGTATTNGGHSGFRIIPVGADGFLVRMQLIKAAERTLDLQYFIFRGDNTGRLLTNAVLRAADRGVRVRVLIDDGETVAGDELITELEGHPSIEIRIFNPFAYRGHVLAIRGVEFMFNPSRLDYRMHNKLLLVDNSVALIGGRNLGDEYFQIEPDGQFADDDVLAVGPIARQLSGTFDEFWNSPLSIPDEALSGRSREDDKEALRDHREVQVEVKPQLKVGGIDYLQRVAAGEPLAGILSGRLPLIWAHAVLVYDSPDKRDVENGSATGRLMHLPVIAAGTAAQTEVLMVTPYLIPGDDGMNMFADLRRRNVRVRILTNSLESSTVALAQAGYMQYRVPLLKEGVELYEIRSRLGNTAGSGQTSAISRYGNYSLHAKLFVFDRKQLFIGSMNFDQRSMHLNTEIGLIIDSPALAEQVAARFEAMTQPANAYVLALRPGYAGTSRYLVWRTLENGQPVEYTNEPERNAWQRPHVDLLAVLPIGAEL